MCEAKFKNKLHRLSVKLHFRLLLVSIAIALAIVGVFKFYETIAYFLAYYAYSAAVVIFFTVVVKDIRYFGKLAVSFLIGAIPVKMIQIAFFLENVYADLLTYSYSLVGIVILFAYLILILPKYAARMHMKFERSAVSKHHLHEGFGGILLSALTALTFLIYFIPISIKALADIIYTIPIVIGGCGQLIGGFLIGRDFDDVIHFRWITTLSDEDNEEFWKPYKSFLEKKYKIHEYRVGFFLAILGATILNSPWELIYYATGLHLGCVGVIAGALLILIGGIIMGRDWIDMLNNLYNEAINRPLLLSLRKYIREDESISSVEYADIPVWLVEGAKMITKKKYLFFKRLEPKKVILLIDDTSGKFLHTTDGKIERFVEFNEDMPLPYTEIPRKETKYALSETDILNICSFLDTVYKIQRRVLPIYAVAIKGDQHEKFMGIHRVSGKLIDIEQKVALSYIIPFEEETEKIKGFFKRVREFFRKKGEK